MGDRRRQHHAAAALLVLPQRGVPLSEEGRLALLSPSTARISITRSSAMVRATSSIPRAWRCRSSPTADGSASSDRSGAREVDAGEFFQLPNVNLYGETVLQPNEIVTHVILPPPGQRSASYEVRFKQSHDWPLALASVNLTMDGAAVKGGSSRDGRRGADSMARPGGRARAGGQDHLRSGRRRGGDRGRGCRRQGAQRQRLQDSDCRRRPSSAPS